MDDNVMAHVPAALDAISRDTERCGFKLASEPKTGALLAVLAASKPAGRLLELGTGTGIGTSWILSGMDAEARLESVDSDPSVVEIARRHLGSDRRVTFHVTEGEKYIEQAVPGTFDLIYADAWPGKFTHLDQTLQLLRPGGMYFIDDLMPQPNWPEDHAPKVPRLIQELERRHEFTTVRLSWATGLMLVVRRGAV